MEIIKIIVAVVLVVIFSKSSTSQMKSPNQDLNWTVSSNKMLELETERQKFSREQFPSLPRSQNKSRETTIFYQKSSHGTRSSLPKPNHHIRYSNHSASGRVKDLVKFYEGPKFNTHNNPSYSAILQRNSNSQNKTSADFGLGERTLNKSYSSRTFDSHNSAKGLGPIALPRSSLLPSSIINNNNKNRIKINISDSELLDLGEELINKDENNAAKYVSINLQEKTTSQSKEDKAPLPLLSVSSEVFNITTIKLFVALLDNYERDTLIDEQVTEQEKREENDFIDAVLTTPVIKHLMGYLENKGYVSKDVKQQRAFFKDLWFTLYSRGRRKLGSSSFEHIFVSELKNGEISGLHNWLYFHREERENRINYLGYLKYLALEKKGTVLKLHFNQQNVDKPVGTIFIGTSPELEMSLYTLCFVTRADSDCRLKLKNKSVGIVTHTFRQNTKNYIGSAYPQI